MLFTVFFDIQGLLLLNFLSTEEPLLPMCTETIQSLCRFIKNKRQELLTEGVVLIYDNAHSHVSRVTPAKRAKWEQLDHQLYSPNMSPCDFNVFGSLKKHLKGQRFNSNDELKYAVKD